jgi:hypothetical protein
VNEDAAGGRIPSAYIAHHIPGRLRMQLSAARGDLPFLVRVAERIQQIAAVRWVDLSPRSGSLIIYSHDDNDLPRELRHLGERERLFILRTTTSNLDQAESSANETDSRLSQQILTYAREVDGRLRNVTEDAVDLRALVPLASAFAGVVGSARPGPAPTPLWVTLVIFAFNSFLTLHRDPGRLMKNNANRGSPSSEGTVAYRPT